MSDRDVANLAHRLRGPLAPIATGIELLKLKCDDKEVREVVAMVERQMREVRGVLDELLVR